MLEAVIAIDKALYFIQKARVSCQVRATHLARNKLMKELEEKLGRTADKDEFEEEWERLKGEKESYINDPAVLEAKDRIIELEKWLNNKVKEIVKNHPAYHWFSRVKGIGNLNIGKVVCLIDIKKCPYISSLWKYALGAPIDDGNGIRRVERRQKGKKLEYNIMLKTMCWRLGKSLIRANGKYADYYRQEKQKIIEKLKSQGIEVVPATQLPVENGKRVEKDGKFSLGHVDNMAMRKMIKLFLSHLWLVWREAVGLPITEPYSIGKLGHKHYISPEEMMDN